MPQALKPLLRPDDLIWVHDYHLFPLAEALRALGVGNRIGFFLHTPFVPPALLHALPRADELLRGLCVYDVVGFHTRTYRQAFLDCVSEMLGVRSDNDGRFVYRGRPVHAVVDPIGIDAQSFATTRHSPRAASRHGSCAKACRTAVRSRSVSTGWIIPRACPTVSRPSRGC